MSRENNAMSNLSYILPRRLRNGPAETGRRMSQQLPPGLLDLVVEKRAGDLRDAELERLQDADLRLRQVHVADERLMRTLLFAGASLAPALDERPGVSRAIAARTLARSSVFRVAAAADGFFCRVSYRGTHRQPCWSFPYVDGSGDLAGCLVVNADNGVFMFELTDTE